jgi:hypothetical protein
MSNDQPRAGISRRSLIKRGAAAGAVAWATPAVIGSMGATAAACSGPDIDATDLLATAWAEPANSQTAYTSPTFTPTALSEVLVLFSLYWTANSNPSVTVVGTNVGTFTEVARVAYRNPTATNRSYLMVFRATAPAAPAAGTVAVTLVGANGANFVGHVIELTAPGAPQVSQATTASGDGTTATGTLTSPSPFSAQILLTGIHSGAPPGGNNVVWSLPTGPWTEVDETSSKDSANTQTIQTAFTEVAQTSASATASQTGGPNVFGDARWGAVALEISC